MFSSEIWKAKEVQKQATEFDLQRPEISATTNHYPLQWPGELATAVDSSGIGDVPAQTPTPLVALRECEYLAKNRLELSQEVSAHARPNRHK